MLEELLADLGAFNFARSFDYRLGHAIDVAVHAVEDYLDLYAHCRFLTCFKQAA